MATAGDGLTRGHVRQALAGPRGRARRPSRLPPQGSWPLADVDLGPSLRRDARHRARPDRPRPRPRRHHRHRRREPPEALLVDHGGADDRRHSRPRLRRFGGGGDRRGARSFRGRVVIAQDQEQVDKILSVRDRLPRLRHLLYDEPRGLDDYDEPGLQALEAVMAKGRAALADPAAARLSTGASTPARAPTPRSFSTPPAPPAARRASC